MRTVQIHPSELDVYFEALSDAELALLDDADGDHCTPTQYLRWRRSAEVLGGLLALIAAQRTIGEGERDV